MAMSAGVTPLMREAVVLHAATSLLEQAKPPTFCTQILDYNPYPKHYNLKDLYLQYLGMRLYGLRN
jgi:hypothetical protein